jgi:hypothetical protein
LLPQQVSAPSAVAMAQVCFAIFREKEVRRLEVAMNDPAPVSFVHRRAHLKYVAHRLVHR